MSYFQTKAIRAKDGSKPSQRALVKIVGQRWIAALERLRIQGVSHAGEVTRSGQVLSMRRKDGIAARVQGSSARRTKSDQDRALTDAKWNKVIDGLAEQAIFTRNCWRRNAAGD
jgi:uncharacterized Zn finger protein